MAVTLVILLLRQNHNEKRYAYFTGLPESSHDVGDSVVHRSLLTWILRQEGFEVQLFDSTQYGDGDFSSPQNRAKYLQARAIFSEENLKLLKDTEMAADFLEAIGVLSAGFTPYFFTEDALSRALQLLRVSNPLKTAYGGGGGAGHRGPGMVMSFPEINLLCVGEGEEVVRDLAFRISESRVFPTSRTCG